MDYVSVFEEIEKEYAAYAQQAAPVEEIPEVVESSLEKQTFLERFGFLIPYTGNVYINDVLVTKKADSLVSLEIYGLKSSVFLATRKDIEASSYVSYTEVLNNRYQTYWDSPMGLVYEITEELKDTFKERDGIRIPSVDWTIGSLKEMQFLSYVPRELSGLERYMEKYLKDSLAEVKEEANEFVAVLKRAAHVNVELFKLGIQPSELTRELYEFADTFDFGYTRSNHTEYHRYCYKKETRFLEVASQHAVPLVQFLAERKEAFWSKVIID